VGTLSQQTLGRYQVEAEIGRGAMGVVYRAFDPKIDRVVAIKTISLGAQHPEDERAYRQRFLQEARAAGRLSHPGIVTIFDASEDPETHEPYLVMEYVAGEPLSKVLTGENRKLPLNAALQFAYEIAEALDYAHSQGVIHRDIKPANILITEDGHPKITDFGVARLNQDVVLQTGQLVGSPAYMAPEQMLGKEADARSDLFSLGVVLYSMITGFRPFQGNSAQTVCFKVMNIEPVPVTSFQNEVPAQLDVIISRAIAKDPDDRYQSGAELARDLQKFCASDDSLVEATSFFARTVREDADHTPRSRNRLSSLFLAAPFWSAVGFIIMLGVVAAGVRFTRELRNAADLSVPSPPLPSAPLIQKSPKAKVTRAKKDHLAFPHTRPLPLAPVETAEVEVEILHHFKSGKASIWLDDELVFDRNLRGIDEHHALFRSIEMHQVATFRFPAGKHLLQVRVMSLGNVYDQIETLDADFSANSQRVLVVNCDKRKMQVALQ
jgi:serine/threonine protein kinase